MIDMYPKYIVNEICTKNTFAYRPVEEYLKLLCNL